MIYSKSWTETAEKKKRLRKITGQTFRHSFVWMKDIFLAIWLFLPKASISRFLVNVLHLGEFSVSNSDVLKFEKCAAVSSVKLDYFVSDSELKSEISFGNS